MLARMRGFQERPRGGLASDAARASQPSGHCSPVAYLAVFVFIFVFFASGCETSSVFVISRPRERDWGPGLAAAETLSAP